MRRLRKYFFTVTTFITFFGIVACGPSTAPEHLIAAQEYRSKNELSAAIIHVKNAVQLDPDDPSAHQLLGDLYLLTQKPEAALRAYETAIAHGAQASDLRISVLKAKLESGQYREVIANIRADKTRSAETDKILADAYLKKGQYSKARKLYKALGGPEQQTQLGRLERNSRRYESALQAFSEAYAVLPDSNTLSQFAQMQRYFNPQASIKQFEQLALDPVYSYRATRELVRTFWLVGNKKQAADHLLTLTETYPKKRSIRYLNALHDYMQGKFEAAASGMRTLYYETDREYVLLPLSLAEYSLQNYDNAKRYVRRLLTLDPDNSSAAKLLAAILIREGNSSEILPALQHHVDFSDDPQLLRIIGESAIQDGQIDLALRAFSRARRALAMPNEPELTLFIDLRAMPHRGRLHLPITIDVPHQMFATNCFGASTLLINSDAPIGTNACPETAQSFLHGLMALNKFNIEKAANHFSAALKIDAQLTEPKILLAQLQDPRFSKAGIRHPNPLYEERYRFGEAPTADILSKSRWHDLRGVYSNLASQDHYEALVVEAEFMLSSNQLEKAVELLNELIASHPTKTEAYRVLAQVHIKRSTAQKWLREIKKSLNKEIWSSWEMRMARAEIYENKKNLEVVSQLAALLQDSVDLYPTIAAENRFKLAELQFRIGQKLLAYENFQDISNDDLAIPELKSIASRRLAELQ